MSTTRPTYQALVDAAIEATHALSGWLLADEPAGLRVMATAGAAGANFAIGTLVSAEGAKAFVLASGQPTALLPQGGDTANANAGGALGTPGSVLAVPCGDEEVIGVLEVSGRADGSAFGFDDIEALAGLAHVASAALMEQDDASPDIASPAQLANEIEALARRNPARYAKLATVIEALLSIET